MRFEGPYKILLFLGNSCGKHDWVCAAGLAAAVSSDRHTLVSTTTTHHSIKHFLRAYTLYSSLSWCPLQQLACLIFPPVLLDFPSLAVITPVVGYVPVPTILSVNEIPSIYS